MNYEIGSKFKLKPGKGIYSFGVSLFLMNVDNWIQWVPSGDLWSPQNLKMVQSMGLEFHFKKACKLRVIDLNWGLNYSFTDVSDVDGFGSFNFSEREQIAYIHKHIVNIFTNINYKNWNFNFTGSYTGNRFTESKDKLDGYILINAIVGKNFYVNDHIFSVNLNANNLFDKAYQNQAYYAMPGRNFSLSLKYIYH
jgi:iron complex outermembrane receptor protein